MASRFYNAGLSEIMNGGIVLLTDTIKVMLVTPTYAFDPDHQFVSSVNTNELSGTGYVAGFGGAGRKTLATKTVTKDNVNDKAFFDAADLTWTSINAGTLGWIILIKEITNDAASKLIAALDPTDFPTTGANVTVQFAATGILEWVS